MDYFAANDIAAFKITAGSPTEATTAGRFDATYAAKAIQVPSSATLTSADFIDPTTGAATSLASGWLHFELYGQSSNSQSGVPITLFTNADANSLRVSNTNTGIWSFQYWTGSAWTTITSASISTNSLLSIDLRWIITGSTIFAAIYSGNSLLASATVSATVTAPARFQITGYGLSNSAYYSQFLVSDENTIGAKVASLTPNSNSAVNTAWSSDYVNIVKLGQNDATLIAATSTGDRESYGATDATLPANFSVSSVWINLRARLGASAPTNIKGLLRIGGTDYATSYNISGLNSSSFEPALAAFPVDPSTGAAWSGVTNVNAAEIGVEAAA